MRRYALILAVLLAAVAPPSRAETLVMRNGDNVLRLFDSPCVHGGVLGMLRPEWRAQFKKAEARVKGKHYYACWIEQEGAAYVIFEDEDRGAWPMSLFKPDPGT